MGSFTDAGSMECLLPPVKRSGLGISWCSVSAPLQRLLTRRQKQTALETSSPLYCRSSREKGTVGTSGSLKSHG